MEFFPEGNLSRAYLYNHDILCLWSCARCNHARRTAITFGAPSMIATWLLRYHAMLCARHHSAHNTTLRITPLCAQHYRMHNATLRKTTLYVWHALHSRQDFLQLHFLLLYLLYKYNHYFTYYFTYYFSRLNRLINNIKIKRKILSLLLSLTSRLYNFRAPRKHICRIWSSKKLLSGR
jgi:hypothetical protein